MRKFVVLLLVWMICSVACHVSADSLLVVTLFDASPTETVLLQCDGEAMLINAGTRQAVGALLGDLVDLRIGSFAYLLITGTDHGCVGGLGELLKVYDTQWLWAADDATLTNSDCYQYAALVAGKRNMAFKTPAVDEAFPLGGAQIMISQTDEGTYALHVTHGEIILSFPAAQDDAQTAFLQGRDYPLTLISDGDTLRAQGIYTAKDGP